jgi:hypothetical protein
VEELGQLHPRAAPRTPALYRVLVFEGVSSIDEIRRVTGDRLV